MIFQVGKYLILEYFHEILLDVSKYAKHLHKHVCFHYKYHLSQ